MFCSNCGNEIADKAVLCPKCGLEIVSKGVSTGMLVFGYIASVLIPIVGIIIGVYAMAKSRPGHGVGMIVLSLFFTVMWAAVIA